MKRILSVILSLALLASLLIIPMSVSAETSADDHISAIQSAAAGLQLNEAQKEQFYTPLGIFSNNDTYKTVCDNVITNEDDKFTVGSKVIEIPNEFGTNSNFWEIPAGTDAVVSYQPGYVVDKLDDYSVKIPKEKLKSISFSVKTNIALTIDLRVHNGSINYSTKKISISASDNWQELKWDVSELGVADGANIGSILAVVWDENTANKGFGDGAEVYFGGMFAETNVPDENVTAVNNAENLADCIVAAEKIDTSRYTDETVTALKSAITAAKTALIESYTSDSAALANFVNSEIGVLSKTETLLIGVFGQYYSGGSLGSATVLTSDLEAPNGCVPKNPYLSADENWRYISGNLALLEYVSPGVTEFTNEGMGAGFTAGDYDDIYIYVVDNSYTSRSAFAGLLDQFGALSKPGDWVGSSATGFAVNAVLQGLDNNGYTKIFAHKTKLPIKSNGTYITSIYNDESVIKGFQILKRNGWTDGSEIGFSPMYGVKYCKETVTATSSREIYNGIKAIPVNEWDNGAVLTETADIIADVVGFPPVIKVDGTKAGDNYCGSAEVTVTDTDLVSVTLNGKVVNLDENGKLIVTSADTYTVVATDAKNNTDTVAFTVVDHSLKYETVDAVITETCENCTHNETLTLKVVGGPLVYDDGSDKSTSIIAEKTKGFVGWEGGIAIYKNGKEAENVINAGDYVAKVTIDDVAFAELPFTIEKAIPDYTAPKAQIGHAGEELSTVKLGDGFAWKNPTEKIKYSNGNKFEYDAIYTPADVDNYKIAELKIEVNGIDITPPTGTIKIKETVWDKITNVVFGWFINEKETVTITGSDAGSGVGKIYYYVADAAAENIADDAWTEYTETFKIEKEGNNVVYAKIFDKKGNSETINTDGIVLDTIAPTADVTNKGTYYGSLTVTVKDDNLDTVKLNGKDVTLDEEGKFTVSAADGEQTIVLTDKAGNTATYTVTVIEVKGLDAESAAQGEQIVLTVDTDDKNIGETDKLKIAEKIEKSETVYYFDIGLDKISGGAINETNNVLEIPVDFNFAGKLNVRVLHNHGGDVRVLKALTARPTADFEDGTFYADTENGKLYIYSNKFSAFAVTYHTHALTHVEAKAATAEADGNIEYWYCEGCDKYFSDAAATKEIAKADTVVKYVAPSNGNNGSNNAATGGENATNPTVPGGTSPVTGQTAMTVVLFTILLGALAVMGMAIVKSRKAKNK